MLTIKKIVIGFVIGCLVASSQGALGLDSIDTGHEWELHCMAKILSNYAGPSLSNEILPYRMQFTIFPNGVIKWPHMDRHDVRLTPVQLEAESALKKAILTSSPVEKFPESYLKRRAVACIWSYDNKPEFSLTDNPGTWTTNISGGDKALKWDEVLNPIKKNFKLRTTQHQVHGCIFLVIDPDGHASSITPTRCTRVKIRVNVPYGSIRQAQTAMISAIKASEPFSVTRLSGDEPHPIAALLIYRSYREPTLALYPANYERCPDYVDLYDGSQSYKSGAE